MLLETVDIELVGSCNYRCRMCPHANPEGRDQDFLKVLPWHVFEKIITEALDLGLRTVRLHGSGEPTLYRHLPRAVDYCVSRGLKTLVTTNGSRLTEDLSRDLVSAGLDQLTVSATGYDQKTYHQWMGTDLFYQVREQVRYYVDIAPKVCNLYHLIINPDQIDYEVAQYQSNWIEYTQARYEIWHMHNWSGNFTGARFHRTKIQQRSCGRMFQPVLEVRAGGIDKHYGAVVACCMVLGNDRQAVLGHLDTDSIQDIWNNELYRDLRTRHANGQWNDIPYCRGCDQLYDRPEVLVATNLNQRYYNEIKRIDV